jgi:segregation and condensation protein B
LHPTDGEGVSPLRDDREPAAEEPALERQGGGEESGLSGETAESGVEGAAPETADSIVPLAPGELRRALEAVLFSVADPVPIRVLAELFGVSVHDVRAAVEELQLEYADSNRAFRLEDIAGGVQMLTVAAYDPWVRRFRQKEREARLTGAALETLAVIAYKQPIHKADLESIRGVNCTPTLKTLLDRGLIQVVGRGEGLGKPLLYGTTKRFLESFGIASIRELPQPEIEARLAERAASRVEPEPVASVPGGEREAGGPDVEADQAAGGEGGEDPETA